MLFESSSLRPLPLPDGELSYAARWLTSDEADRCLQALGTEIPWSQHRVRIYGRELNSPRLSSWHGDADASYRYSGTKYLPLPWTPTLTELRQRLQAALGASFNGVLANRYRDGNDAMGWHADDESELGPSPLIASISLGAERRFCLKHRESGKRLDLNLAHGSLLLMAGTTQRHWLHCLPRQSRLSTERINLTFRTIRPQSYFAKSQVAPY